MPSNKRAIVLLVIILIFSIGLYAVFSYYIIGKYFSSKKAGSSKTTPSQTIIVIKTPQDLTKAIENLSPKFTSPEGVSRQLKSLVEETENYQPPPNSLPNTREWIRQSKYRYIFTQLQGQYYATFDKEIFQLAKALEEFYKREFPKYYKPEEWKFEQVQ